MKPVTKRLTIDPTGAVVSATRFVAQRGISKPPTTSLILWLEKLRQDSSILKEFENWLESKTHKEEGRHLRIKMEADDYILTHQAAVAATHRYLLEKLRAMLDNKGEKAKGENK